MTAEMIRNMVCTQFLESTHVTYHANMRSYYLTNYFMLGSSLNI